MGVKVNWCLLVAMVAIVVVFLYTLQEVLLYKWHGKNSDDPQQLFVHILQFAPTAKVLDISEQGIHDLLNKPTVT